VNIDDFGAFAVLSIEDRHRGSSRVPIRTATKAIVGTMSATDQGQSRNPPLRIGGGAGGFNWLPVIAADREGMFARRNLAIEVKRLGAVDKATAAVQSGDVDIAITPPEGAIRDCVGGGSLRIIAGNVNRLPLSLITNPRIRRFQDLRGARLGTSSMTEGTALYTMEVLRQHGLHYPGDYEFSVVGVHPARWKALQEGSIDAAVQLIPLNFVAEDAGYVNLGEVSDHIPEIVFTAFIVDRAAAQRRRADIIEFLRGVIEGTRWVCDPANDEALLALTKELTQAEGKYGRRTLDYMRAKKVFSPDLSIPEAAFAKSIELMQKAGLADDRLVANARDVLDDSYRLAALKAA
jgi:ABC-type nitrate/sulfonate/bicarbonate transport system substrate-binding protein